MERLDEIEAAIRELPPDEFRRLSEWIHSLDHARWVEQIDTDSTAGRLDFLFAEAEEEAAGGRLAGWPPNE